MAKDKNASKIRLVIMQLDKIEELVFGYSQENILVVKITDQSCDFTFLNL